MPEGHDEPGRGLADLAYEGDPFPSYARPRPEAPFDRVTLRDGLIARLLAHDDVAATKIRALSTGDAP